MTIDHINLVVHDLDLCSQFYQSVVGMHMTFSKHLSGAWFEKVTGITHAEATCQFLEFPDAGCRLELLQFTHQQAPPSEAPSPSHPGFRHIAIETRDMKGLLERLTEAGYPIISPPVTVPFDVGSEKLRKQLFYFRDPEGNVVEAAAYQPH